VWARSPSRPLDGDDLPDLLQREAEPLRLADEREQVERVATVHAVAGRRAPGRGQNPRLLVQPQCLPARAAAPRDLTDQEPVSPHDHHDKPGPVGEGQEVESVWSLLEVERRLGGERYRSCRTQVLGDRVGLVEPEAGDVTVPLVGLRPTNRRKLLRTVSRGPTVGWRYAPRVLHKFHEGSRARRHTSRLVMNHVEVPLDAHAAQSERT